MKELQVVSEKIEESYSIYIGENIQSQIVKKINLSKYSKVIVITDENVASKLLSKLENALEPIQTSSIIISPGEHNKNLSTLETIWVEMLKYGCDRKSLIINFGGGVIGDMGGLAASLFMRGIDFIQIPTTTLSQVDASIGGKLAVDFQGVKNSLGLFNQPQAVFIDTNNLKTLDEKEFISGFAEIIKHGLIQDPKHFLEATNKKPTEFSPQELCDIIFHSCQIKAKVVEIDPTEQGLRKILNFGHTIGHAIESISLEINPSNYLTHGQSVAIGMVAESYLSNLCGLLSQDEFNLIESTIARTGLPTRFSKQNSPSKDEQIHTLLSKMSKDKKNFRGEIRFVLLEKIGQAKFDVVASHEDIEKSLEYVLN